jgi:D-3-phosphoglycerate dehydrogenase
MSKLKVVISDYDFGEINVETIILKEKFGNDISVVGLVEKDQETLIRETKDADAIITQYAHINESVINGLERCKVIARYGTGVDIVDVDTATKQGIIVTNVPDYCMNEVADHAITLLLTLVRKIKTYDKAIRRGEWRWQSGQKLHRIQGKKLGILGFGRIGKEIAKRAQGFSMDVIVHTPTMTDVRAALYGVTAVSFDTLLKESDYIIIQAPLTPQTEGLFDDKQFSMMKDGVILINTGRGPIVKNEALIRALQSGKVAGAGLDDIEEEPIKLKDWSPDSPLFNYENVIVTPHAAYYSEESILESRRRATDEVARILAGGAPYHQVNELKSTPSNTKGR